MIVYSKYRTPRQIQKRQVQKNRQSQRYRSMEQMKDNYHIPVKVPLCSERRILPTFDLIANLSSHLYDRDLYFRYIEYANQTDMT